MFSQVSVILSTIGWGLLPELLLGGGCLAWGCGCLIWGVRRQTPLRWLLPQSVCILLECILVKHVFFHKETVKNNHQITWRLFLKVRFTWPSKKVFHLTVYGKQFPVTHIVANFFRQISNEWDASILTTSTQSNYVILHVDTDSEQTGE